jgi:sugar O-acyltransferase (sialic acid O-acetyltransferase NeuD family)
MADSINPDSKICIVGAGGFGREVLCCLIDSISSQKIRVEEMACFLVPDEGWKESKVMGVKVIPQSAFDPSIYQAVVAIGDPFRRKKVVDSLPGNTEFTTIIHPSAVVSDWVEIGAGSVITAGTIVTCNIKIGKHAHLNLHTTIGHDCIAGDYFTTAPAVNISGNCRFGDVVYLGTNAAVREGISICGKVVIGMGGIVVKDIMEEGIYVGNPVKKLDKKIES